jgi:hypothetical protein
MATPAPTPRFQRDGNIEETLDAHPGVADVLAGFGLKCVDSASSRRRMTLEEGMLGLSGVDVENACLSP